MEYQITVRLTDQEYKALTAEAMRSRKQPETILHELMSESFRTFLMKGPSPTGHEFMEQQYREGKTLNIPLRRPLTSQERELREQLGKVLSTGKSLSEMVIEDRDPFSAPIFESARQEANLDAFLQILNRGGGEPPREGDEM